MGDLKNDMDGGLLWPLSNKDTLTLLIHQNGVLTRFVSFSLRFGAVLSEFPPLRALLTPWMLPVVSIEDLLCNFTFVRTNFFLFVGYPKSPNLC